MSILAGEYRLVPACVTDIGYIMMLERQQDSRRFVVQGTAPQHMREILSPAYLLAVIRDDAGRRMGFCLCHTDGRNRSFEIRRIVIEHKGRGVCTAVLSALFRYAFAERRLARVWLDVYADNPRAMALYTRLGMQEDGVLRGSHREQDGTFRDQHIFSLLRTDAAGEDYAVSD